MERLAILVILLGTMVGVISKPVSTRVLAASVSPVNLTGGQSLTINCEGKRLDVRRMTALQLVADCAILTITPTLTPSPTAMPMPTGPGAGVDGIVSTAIVNESLGTCSVATHDKYVLTGPDSKKYRTWHPRKDPQTGCIFGHEHGDDPARSNISGILPVLFSLYDQGSEAHEGFKVGVVNYGDVNNEGSMAMNSTRVVVHQGTGGAKRFTTQMHSLEIAFLGGPNGKNAGQKFFEGGMADTGGIGSICANPRQGRTVMQTDCNETSDYEIWQFSLKGMTVSWAVFDPITERNPVDNTTLLLAGNKGCTAEFYVGPFNSASGTYRPQFGKLPQGLGYLATYKSGDVNQPQSQFKMTRPACDVYSQIGTKN